MRFHIRDGISYDRPLINPIAHAEYTPDGSLIATIGQTDCNVKIWSRKDAKHVIDYQFTLLQHPYAILSFSWRNSIDTSYAFSYRQQTHTRSDSILLTNCQDGVSRIWTQWVQDAQGTPVFNLAAHITLRPDHPFSQPFVCHWLHSADVTLSSIHRSLVLEENQDTRELYRKKTRNLKKNLREFQEMIMHVGTDGSLTVWGIHVFIQDL